jgi:hypothetical protein
MEYINYKDISLIITVLALFISIIVLLMSFFMRIIDKNKRENYDFEKKYALIESQRNFYENKIYELTKRLSMDNNRWVDLNQMLLSAQENIYKTKNNKIIINSFLKNCGIVEDDLIIDDKLIFTIIPLNKSFVSLYKNIKDICSQNNLDVVKSDEQYIDGDILNHIVKLIIKSRFIIAVLDGRNANVYYELGIAHTLGKDVILLASASEYVDMPFNIKSKDIAFYNSPKTLSIELNDRIKKMLVRG